MSFRFISTSPPQAFMLQNLPKFLLLPPPKFLKALEKYVPINNFDFFLSSITYSLYNIFKSNLQAGIQNLLIRSSNLFEIRGLYLNSYHTVNLLPSLWLENT